MASISLQNINKQFGPVTAVDQLNLIIEDREFVVLVGPSGCGKSTTLRMIAGLEEITSGEIRIGERIVNQIPAKDRDIAMVFQNYALYPHMSVRKNMEFGLTLRNLNPPEIKQRIERTSHILGLQELLERKPAQLSGGQQQRVALGRAMVREPAAFLFDEPLSNLDAQLRMQMRDELQLLHRELNTTMVFVTHDQVEAMTLGDRIAVLDRGRLQQFDTPRQIYFKPDNLFVAKFIGHPSMNLLSGSMVKENGQLFFTQPHLKIRLPPKWHASFVEQEHETVVLGIRPESVTISDSSSSAQREYPVIRGELKSTQLIGSECLISLQSGNQSLVGKTEVQRNLTTGTTLSVQLDLSQSHLFSAQTGLRITD